VNCLCHTQQYLRTLPRISLVALITPGYSSPRYLCTSSDVLTVIYATGDITQTCFALLTISSTVYLAMATQIRIAIVGGSITGCTLANGLLRYPNAIFDIFESKSSFEERGSSVGIAPNAQSALRAMNLDADGMLKAAGAVRTNASIVLAISRNLRHQTSPADLQAERESASIRASHCWSFQVVSKSSIVESG